MTRSTSQVRALPEWNPPCRDKPEHLDDLVHAVFSMVVAVMQRWGYVLRQSDTGGHVCRRITGGTGWSLHAYGPFRLLVTWNGVRITLALAVDFNWSTNPYGSRLVTDMPRGMVEQILQIVTAGGVRVLRWGGYYSGNKDAMHFEIVASAAELEAGLIDPNAHVQPTREKDMPSGPATVITPDDREWQFALGLPADGVRHVWFNNVDGHDWHEVPNEHQVTSGPGACVALGAIFVGARGGDGHLWVTERHGDSADVAEGWLPGWYDLSGVITSAPSLAAKRDGTVVASARGTDGADYRRARKPNGEWTPWVSLGGRLDAP